MPGDPDPPAAGRWTWAVTGPTSTTSTPSGTLPRVRRSRIRVRRCSRGPATPFGSTRASQRRSSGYASARSRSFRVMGPFYPLPCPGVAFRAMAEEGGAGPEAAWVDAGLLDPGAPGAEDRRELLRWLEERGVTLEEMRIA